MTYIIRNADNIYLWSIGDIESMDMYGNINAEPNYQFSCPDPEYADRFDSRRRAAEVAEENGGIVQELTIKTQDCDLEWMPSAVLNDRLFLWDGGHCIDVIYIKDGMYVWEDEDYDDLHEVKQLAEAAARKTWT